MASQERLSAQGMSQPQIPPRRASAVDASDQTSRSQPFHQSEVSDEEKQHSSWRYHGYPALSKWLASSDDFFVLRRYAGISARCLLHLQHEIAKKERELNKFDELSMEAPPGQGGCDSFDDDPFPLRTKIIKDLAIKVQQYYDLAESYAKIRSIPTARQSHVQNLQHWFSTYPEAIRPSEQHFMDPDKRGDLFPVLAPVVARTKSPLRLWLERWRWLRSQFTLGARPDRVDTAIYHSGTAFEQFVNILTVVFGLCLLFGPMWWLNYVSTDAYRLAIITGFVTAFTTLMWSAAGQRPFEILGYTAAYAAVLTVFLQQARLGEGSSSNRSN